MRVGGIIIIECRVHTYCIRYIGRHWSKSLKVGGGSAFGDAERIYLMTEAEGIQSALLGA